jgi:hypothetical protein
MDENTTLICIGAGVIIIFFLWFVFRSNKSNYMYIPAEISQPIHYWQNQAPSLRVENQFHRCMLSECNADYTDYPCRQKCYLKTMKNGTEDRTDLICRGRAKTEDEYYMCLDSVYGTYHDMDRMTGLTSCPCKNHKTGYNLPDGSCVCRDPTAPLSDRNPTNRFGQVVQPKYSDNDVWSGPV